MARRIKAAQAVRKVKEEMEEAKAPSERCPPKQPKQDPTWGLHRDADDDMVNLQLVPWREEVRVHG
jgi:hypothetical protein